MGRSAGTVPRRYLRTLKPRRAYRWFEIDDEDDDEDSDGTDCGGPDKDTGEK